VAKRGTERVWVKTRLPFLRVGAASSTCRCQTRVLHALIEGVLGAISTRSTLLLSATYRLIIVVEDDTRLARPEAAAIISSVEKALSLIFYFDYRYTVLEASHLSVQASARQTAARPNEIRALRSNAVGRSVIFVNLGTACYFSKQYFPFRKKE